jgi:hypothetical protein
LLNYKTAEKIISNIVYFQNNYMNRPAASNTKVQPPTVLLLQGMSVVYFSSLIVGKAEKLIAGSKDLFKEKNVFQELKGMGKFLSAPNPFAGTRLGLDTPERLFRYCFGYRSLGILLLKMKDSSLETRKDRKGLLCTSVNKENEVRSTSQRVLVALNNCGEYKLLMTFGFLL